ANRIGIYCENNGNDRCGLLECGHCTSECDDHIDVALDELGGDLGVGLTTSLCPSILDRNSATVSPAEFAQPLHESSGPWPPGRSRANAQISNGRQFRLLAARRDRPRRRCCAPKERDELATPHSITSSAVLRSDAGTVRPSMTAVCALMTSSNLVDCTTG